MSDVQIRLATEADLPIINDIHNHFVRTCTCTYEDVPLTLEARQRWYARHGEKHPITIATIAQEVVGWGALSAFHERPAYRFTVEDSIYVKPSAQGRGVGRTILADLIDRAGRLGYRSIVALIDSGQTGSVALHERAGFTRVGLLPSVGFKFERWLDVIYMQKLLVD